MGRDSRRLRVVLVLLVLTSLTFLTLDSRNGGGFSGLRSVASKVFGPLQRFGGSAGGSIGDSVSGVVHGNRDRDALRAAQKQNADLQATINGLQQAQQDEKALQALGFLAGQASFQIKPARVIAFGDAVGTFTRTVTLDIGSSNGIAKDMAVVTGDGLVGRVDVVSAGTCIVLLADDPQFGVGVQIVDASGAAVGTANTATVQGAGRGKPLVFADPDPQAQLVPGERLVSVANTFPSGLQVGTITRSTGKAGDPTQTADVAPAVNLDGLDVVGIITNYGQGGTRGIVPPTTVSPSAAPSASATPTKK